MARRKQQRPDGTTTPRRIRSGTVRRMLGLAHYKFCRLLAHRCLVDGSELHEPGEEYTTQACPFCGTCYDIGSDRVFVCGRCKFRAPRDEKAGFTYCVKHLVV